MTSGRKKGYWMMMLDITDMVSYRHYIETISEATAMFGGKYLVRGSQYQNPEDKGFGRHVVVEFESYETALACYRSAAYQQGIKLRLASSVGHFAIVEGA